MEYLIKFKRDTMVFELENFDDINKLIPKSKIFLV